MDLPPRLLGFGVTSTQPTGYGLQTTINTLVLHEIFRQTCTGVIPDETLTTCRSLSRWDQNTSISRKNSFVSIWRSSNHPISYHKGI